MLMVILGLSFALLCARLLVGPMSISFLTPYLKQVLVFDRRDLTLEFDDTVLALEGVRDNRDKAPAIKIKLLNIRIINNEGVETLSIPSGGVGLSIRALTRGIIAPSTIELEGAKLSVDWDGAQFLEPGEAPKIEDLPDVMDEASAQLIPFFVRQLLSPPDQENTASYLHTIRIMDADLVMHERYSNTDWVFPGTEMELARSNKGLALQTNLFYARDGTRTEINLSGNYDNQRRETALKVRFRDLNPAKLAGESAVMAPLAAVDMLADGVLYISFDASQRVVSAGFEFDAGPGFVNTSNIYPAPVHFDHIRVKGEYIHAMAQLSLEQLVVAFGPTRFDGEGLLYRGEGGLGIRLFGDLTDVTLADLKTYWPPELAKGGYNWVTRNITAGTASSGNLRVSITPEMWALDIMPEDIVDFAFRFEGIEAHYLRPMPPIQNGIGYARLTARKLELTVTDGVVAGLPVKKSLVLLDNIGIKGETTASIDVNLTGELPAALALIDSDPLGYPGKYGLKPDSVKGSSVVNLKLDFPLVRNLTLADVDFDVNARLKDVEIPQLFENVGLDSGVLEMKVTRSGIEASGSIGLEQVPFDFTWKEEFGENVDLPTTYTLLGNIQDAQWQALGLPFQEYVHGPALIDLRLRGKGALVVSGSGEVDLTGSSLELSRLEWLKPAGQAAGMSFKLNKQDEQLNFRDITYVDGLLSASGALKLGPDNAIDMAILHHFARPGIDFAGSLVKRADESYLISMTGAQFNAGPVIEKLVEGKLDSSNADMPAFSIDAVVSNVATLRGTAISDFKASATYIDNRWQRASMEGFLAGDKTFTYKLEPTETGRSLKIRSSDAGELTRALGLFPNAVGGELAFDADLGMDEEGDLLTGQVSVKDFKVVQAPVLGNILTVGSLTGASDLLKGEGISFARLDIPFSFRDGVVKLKKSRAYGPAIGLTMEGDVDLEYDSLALNGTIVPAYTLNSILKMVPVVGNLLLGGKGEGLFALTYQITGPVNEPKIGVNPLSALAPGFLRGIFETFEGSAKTSDQLRKQEKQELQTPVPPDAETVPDETGPASPE